MNLHASKLTLSCAALLFLGLAAFPATPARAAICPGRTITAHVVALDQPLMFNRLGAQNVNGIIYALRRDVIDQSSGRTEAAGGALAPGNVALRPDKRPRPLVLRVSAGDCLQVEFTNLLAGVSNPNNAPVSELHIDDQVADRHAGFHPQGLQLLDSIASDSSNVGKNGSSLVDVGETTVYAFFAPKEGTFLVTSGGASFGGDGMSGNGAGGLFGVVNVEPPGARYYRSQVTEEEMRLGTQRNDADGSPILTPTGQPAINHEARYPNVEPWIAEGKAGQPIFNMLNGAELVHSDINAIIAGPNEADGTFPRSTYPLENQGLRNPTVPNRLEPFRELTVVFHDEGAVAQAFPNYYDDPVFKHTLAGVKDGFLINYGSGGIGSEIIANRLGVGPMHDCLTCAFEEFFLSSYTVGDPAMVVDVPANAGLEAIMPGEAPPQGATGIKASKAFYPDDPSNVHHAYTNDAVRFRNVHSGLEQHVFHLHNHQWLFSAADDNANYLDAQGVGPGSGYTYEINFGGAGNRNKTAGDAIFHCHFYPHFAQGMWELFRVHDVFESGTRLAASGAGADSFHSAPFALQDGTPALDPDDPTPGARVRALPDGEIVAGTPIPALVPLPGKPMAPVPGKVVVVPKEVNGAVVGSVSKVTERDKHPGYPFYIAGIEETVGQRAPTPPLDMAPAAGGWDGGLPRHALEGVQAGGEFVSTVSRLDFSKVVTKAKPVYFPEDGTDVEKVAMDYHAQRTHPSSAVRPDGTIVAGDFITNGAPPVPGAPYQDPCIDDYGVKLNTGVTGQFFDAHGGMGTRGASRYSANNPRIYKGANIQFDAVFNKVGYHYPQQRIITLWEDAMPTINKTRAPEPLVMRMNTFDCAMYQHTNLVPEYFEMDDYQVRTPTDIISQHVHLTKWDLVAADGGGNGWNYEDGTLSPGAVRERIHAINAYNAANPANAVATLDGETYLEPKPHPFFGQYGRPDWLGARTTLQRWYADPVVNRNGVHRGLGMIFTHDHFGPSTHQQVGLYGTILAEPPDSTWVHNETGELMGTRHDGGPTSWQAAILTGDVDGDGNNDSYREFFFEYSDFQHAYEKGVYVGADENGIPAPDTVTSTSFRNAINVSAKDQANPVFPDIEVALATCPGGVPRPCPEAISISDPGMLVANYRNEPVALRVFDPDKLGPDGKPGMQADGLAGDLAYALQSRSDRMVPQMNTILGDTPYSPLTAGLGRGDPFTPMMRAYVGDRVRMKVQAGGHEEEHTATVHGVKWLQGGSSFGWDGTSGWRNGQSGGISEQFTFAAPIAVLTGARGNIADYAYATNSAQDGWWSGAWGLMRTYRGVRPDLFKLPNNDAAGKQLANSRDFVGVCPAKAEVRSYDITAVLANDALSAPSGVAIVPGDDSATMHVGGALKPDGGTLVFNPRTPTLSNGKSGPLHDPTAILYVRTEDLDKQGRLRPGAPVEPLVLRAAAGECIRVTLRNRLPEVMPDLATYNPLMGVVNRDRNHPQGVSTFQSNLVRPSSYIGLHPQLVGYDVTAGDGANVGVNPNAIVGPGLSKKFQWYAGDLALDETTLRLKGQVRMVATPVEFGGSSLMPADKIKQGQRGLVGSLVIEPEESTWVEADQVGDRQGEGATRLSRASATVTTQSGDSFRDFSLVMVKGMNHRYGDGSPVEGIETHGNSAVPEDSQDGGQASFNYGSEPLWFRFGLAPNSPIGRGHGGGMGYGDVTNANQAYSNSLVGGDDPATPVFSARPGEEARIHVVAPHTTHRGSAFNLHGHVWQRAPYLSGNVPSQRIGDNPMSMYLGGQESITAPNHFDIVLPSAGGEMAVTGDYLFRDQGGSGNAMGLWGILRVE